MGAQHIAEQIAKEMEPSSHSEHIIRPSDPIDSNFADTETETENEIENENDFADVDWAFRVVSHSSLKRSRRRRGVMSSIAHWLSERMFARWNQNAISATRKAGDCTPLQFESEFEAESAEHRARNNAYLTIELFRAVRVRAVSLFHYRSPILTQSAIDAAPKRFQIWGSAALDEWVDLGNFTYEYADETPHTQHFEVAMGDAKKNETEAESEAVEMGASVDVGVYEHWKAGFKFIAFRLLSNQGGGDYGCIYRLKVFGEAVRQRLKEEGT